MLMGHDFLRAQVSNSIIQHQILLDALRAHANQADDPQFRELCVRYLATMERHQVMIEAYGMTIGTRGDGAVKNAIGAVLGKARDVVDGFRETDFLRVVGDIVMIRQAQDTFGTFARAGQILGDAKLAELGQACEADHDAMQRDFNQYIATLFAAHVQGTATAAPGAANSSAKAHT